MSWVLLGELTPDGFCWKTSEDSLRRTKVKLYGKSSLRWPTTGSMRAGRVYALPMSAPRTDVSGGSALLPTPNASDHFGGETGGTRPSGSKRQLDLPGAVTLLPTPTALLGDSRGAQAKRYLNPERSNDLDDAIAWLGDHTSPQSDDGNTSWEQPPLFP
jgi:hypothetical protein